MTREEAHTLLEVMAINLTGAIANSEKPVTEQTKLMAKQIEAIDMAISALQQPIDITAEQWDMYVDEIRKLRESFITPQTDTDLISRAEVKKLATKFFGHWVVFENRIDNLPSVSADRPTRGRKDATEEDYHYCDDCEAVEMCMWYPYRECQFKVSRPSGQWIAQKHKGEYVEFDVYVCSECGIVGGIQANEWNYCPNCGADMRGESDEQYTG